MTPFFRRKIAVAGAALFAAHAHAAVTVINFDGTGAGTTFSGAPVLASQYSPEGVTFAGIARKGGVILNQGVNLGFSAHSGTDFMAFSTNTSLTTNIEDISFANAATNVSIWAASSGGGVMTMTAYDAHGVQVSAITRFVSRNWSQLSISGAGIAMVRLLGPNGAYAYDDLAVTTAVPEPSGYAMLLAGLGVVGWLRRRRA